MALFSTVTCDKNLSLPRGSFHRDRLTCHSNWRASEQQLRQPAFPADVVAGAVAPGPEAVVVATVEFVLPAASFAAVALINSSYCWQWGAVGSADEPTAVAGIAVAPDAVVRFAAAAA